MTRSVLPAGLLLAILTLAACGGGGTTTPSTTPAASQAVESPASSEPDPGEPTPGTALKACELITADDIKTATKAASVDPGVGKDSPTSLSPGQTECAYEGDYGRIIVELTPEDGANLYDAARGAYKDAVDIGGLAGDGAFNSDGNNRAFIWKGAVTIMLTMFLDGELDQTAVATSLGQAMLDKL
jgi:hypothetical protein